MANCILLPLNYPNHLCFSTNCSLLPHSTNLRDRRFAPSWPGVVTRSTIFSAQLKVTSSDTRSEINCDNLGFNPFPTDYMYVMKCSWSDKFSDGEFQPFGEIELNPFSSDLNYGQGIIEGLKAYKKENDSVLLFRPEANALRMRIGADRLCMPAPTVNQFVEAVRLLFQPIKDGGAEPINLLVENEVHCAVPGGVGNIKAIGNYAMVNGFDDVLYLDAVHNKYLEEISTANIFVVKEKTICTPELRGTILPGIARESVVDIAPSDGFQVEERLVWVEELPSADEVFCTGNAVGLLPVGSITYLGKRLSYRGGGRGTVSWQLSSELNNIQRGLTEDKRGWTFVLK